MGICVNPLAIVLELAPRGALDQRLKHYQRSGDKLTPKSVQQIILQIAKALGANVIITSSSNEKLERAKDLGADELINYKENSDWGSKAFQAAGGGVNLVIEIGGGSTFDQSMEALTIGGHISLIDALGGIKTELNLLQIVFKNVHTHGITVGSREDHEEMNRFLEEHQIHPVIGKEVAFEQGADAIMGIAAGNHFGKIINNLDR